VQRVAANIQYQAGRVSAESPAAAAPSLSLSSRSHFRESSLNDMNTSARLAALLFLCTLLLPPAVFAQGSLTPPGGPAPTMQTLDQLGAKSDQANSKLDQVNVKTDTLDAKAEKRIPIDAAHTPGDDTAEFIIPSTGSGSYYLTRNINVTKATGIRIDAGGVTLDLNGFEISRTSGSGGNGILISATSHRASVRNGSIKGFLFGVNSVTTNGFTARACAFRDLAVSSCTAHGITTGPGAVLERCRADGNSGSSGISAGAGSSLTNCTATDNTAIRGIFAGDGSSLTNCTASNNSGTHGIRVGSGSTLTNCAAYFNRSSAAISAGIATGSGCTINRCSSGANTSTAATLTPSTGMGFEVGSNSTIQGCTADGNKGDGINISGDSIARDNTGHANGIAGDGAGIHATGADNRIEGNNVTDNDRGIDVDSAGNFVVKNSASGNATNFEIAAGNAVGPVVAAPASPAISGSTGTSNVGSTDPWANISY
jgi:parallel beta-helix repeat protein